ncbi:response regulator transcription factor [Bradyrhizobium sp. Ash2021]|uniref:response regulator transcription factor n=1 Tax=Bradyrhizobium sp. Ash2021 TaxID=2954771 RepID=UPI002814C34B|nr:response regulator transcription factor [Bradyrhizobium sp. Ash2021]WMT73378.1 response regulator transcription factor [Bradyrhizobium sp. Ash2021]
MLGQRLPHSEPRRRDDRGPTRFLIVEDHPLFREALEGAVCLASAEAEILQATSVDGALDVLSSADQVDLILLDLSMPGTSGLSGLIQIRNSFPKTPIVVISVHEHPQIVNSVLSLGVSAYIPKSISKRELAHSINEVLRGSIYLPKCIQKATKGRQTKSDIRELLQRIRDLTPQQLRVLDMLRGGLQNKQIAYQLGICETTVKVHVSEVLRKLKVPSRSKAIIEVSKIDFINLTGGPAVKNQESGQMNVTGTRTALPAGDPPIGRYSVGNKNDKSERNSAGRTGFFRSSRP